MDTYSKLHAIIKATDCGLHDAIIVLYYCGNVGDAIDFIDAFYEQWYHKYAHIEYKPRNC